MDEAYPVYIVEVYHRATGMLLDRVDELQGTEKCSRDGMSLMWSKYRAGGPGYGPNYDREVRVVWSIAGERRGLHPATRARLLNAPPWPTKLATV